MSKTEKVKFWTDREQTRFLAGFVLGVVFSGVTMSIAFYGGLD